MTLKTNISINIYCDESRHTSDPRDPYMVIGGIACPRGEKREIVHKIHVLKKRYNTQGEFGWKRLSPNRRDFYWAILDLFARESCLAFRCLVVDRNILDHEKYNQGDQELGFYKLYYQMLIHWLKPQNKYHLYLDRQQNRTQHRFSTLRNILRIKLSAQAEIACLEPVGSKHIPVIGMTDLLIGAVGYEWNGRDASKAKLEFCKKLAESMNMRDLGASTSYIRDKFDIFHFTGR